MKIILINNLYKPYARGGVENVVENAVKAFLKNGYDVKIITTRPFFSRRPIFEKETNIYYIRSFYYHLNIIPKFLRFFWHIADMFWPGDYIKIRKILKKEEPDLVISHNLKGVGLLASRAIKSLGIKYAHTLHDIQLLHPSGLMIYGEERKIDSFLSGIYSFLSSFIMARPDFIISPSLWLMNLHEKKGFFDDSKKHIMPNPIDLIVGDGEKEKKEDELNFFYAGQIESHKGVSLLIEVFKSLREEKIKLTVAGDGSMLQGLKERAGDNIIFLGRKNKDEIMRLMGEADCAIVPSLCYENSPTVIYEAFAAGLPVIASRLGGITELLPAEFLFEAGNQEDLTGKIRWFKKNRDKISEEIEKNKKLAEDLKTDNYIKKIVNL